MLRRVGCAGVWVGVEVSSLEGGELGRRRADLFDSDDGTGFLQGSLDCQGLITGGDAVGQGAGRGIDA